MTAAPALNITSRPFEGDADFWRVRDLLVDAYPLTPTGFNWEVRRWDGQRFHNDDAALNPEWARTVRLWETDAGRLVGVAHPDYAGNISLQLHPDYRDIEAEMIAWGEASLAVPVDGQRRVEVFVYDYDAPRLHLLAARGYRQMPDFGVTRRMRFGARPLPAAEIAPGYVMRTTRPDDWDDCQRMADLLNAAFNRTVHNAREYWNFCANSPSFRYDLNLVAEAPDGSFAAHVGVNWEPINRYGVFEPVCTHPAHQRHGLARALMFEGMCRLKALGALDAYVDTGDMIPANALYDAVGFTEAYTGHTWRKVW